MFEFHRIGWINRAKEEVSGWWAYITTKEQLEAFLSWNGSVNAYAWVEMREYGDHCRTNRGCALDTLLQIKMQQEGKSRFSLMESVSYIGQVTTSTAIDIFSEDGEVYINEAGGCRRTELIKKPLKELLFEECENKNYTFPDLSSKDVRITRWPEGKHYYISVNGVSVTINGKSKYNTIEAAEEARTEYIRNNRFKFT